MSIDAKLAIMMPPVSVCHQLSWNGLTERLDAPDDGLRIQRLADAAEKAQTAQIVADAPAACRPSSACGSPSVPCTRR